MSFTRQILIFIAIWALLIYIFLTKLTATSGKESDEDKRLNRAFSYIETSKSLDRDLRQLLDEYTNDNNDSKLDLLKKINSKFQSSGESSMYLPKSQLGIPSIEYEQGRRRVENNIMELWNFISSETQKIEKFIKTEDSQQSLKQLSSFVQLATEQKR